MSKRKPKRKSNTETLSEYLHSVQSRPCAMCKTNFTPPLHPTAITTGENHKTHCAKCRRIVRDATMSLGPPLEEGQLTTGPGAPIRQVVFDLETFSLDRGWGVTMVASFLIHGDPAGPKRITISHRDSKAWKSGKRSEDRELAEEVFSILNSCHIAYAHNGERFDMRWLRTVALKYGLQMPRLKLIDPCQIAWKRYRLGRNSLEALADFLQLEQKKLHIAPDVWRWALMDNDAEAWALIIERCKSDVELLNAVASKVTGDIGLIDYQGSYR